MVAKRRGVILGTQADVPIPKLCTLVTASAFDAAVHDAFGKVHGVNCYQTYNPEFMSHDLAHYLGPEFRGESLERYVSRTRSQECRYITWWVRSTRSFRPMSRTPLGMGCPEISRSGSL